MFTKQDARCIFKMLLTDTKRIREVPCMSEFLMTFRYVPKYTHKLSIVALINEKCHAAVFVSTTTFKDTNGQNHCYR